ncbi:MAG: HAD-IIB family hydrolase [Erysipelotrichaceae bacterium]
MQLIGTDYDGTLFHHKQVSTHDLVAIAKWRQAGNCFGLVTGRSAQSMDQELERLNLEVDFVITNNGGVVRVRDQVLFQAEMDFGVVQTLLPILKTMQISSYVMNDGFRRSKTIVNETIEDRKYGAHHQLLEEEVLLKQGHIAQIVVSLIDGKLAKELAAWINETYATSLEAFVNVDCVDIVPKGIDKAKGLARVANHLQVEPSAIFAIGDSYNDVPMLEAYTGYTLEWAEEAIQSSAKRVVSSVGAMIEELL